MVSVWGVTDRGTVRKQNQDSCAFAAEDAFAWGVVCDGMGGAAAGEVASRIAAETFTDRVAQCRRRFPRQQEGRLLMQAAAAANGTIYARADADPSCRGMGTTMVGAILRNGTAWVLNVGDSRAYHVTPEGIQRITKDHSVVQELVDSGHITQEEARFHPRRNLITRALGTDETVKADLFQRTVHSGEHLLLCSDGLVNELADGNLWEEVCKGGTAEEICRRLMDRALENGASDNVSIVLFQI